MNDLYRKTARTEAYRWPFAPGVPQRFRDAILADATGRPYIKTYEGDSYLLDDGCVIAGDQKGVWRIDGEVFAATYKKIPAWKIRLSDAWASLRKRAAPMTPIKRDAGGNRE